MADERLELEKVSPAEEAPLMRPGYPRGGYPDATAYGYGYGYGDDDERVYLRRMWHAIKKRKLVILVIAIIVTSVVTVEMYRTKSIYQASTTLEIAKENKTMVRSGDVVIQTDDSSDIYQVAMSMKTRIRQLQSRPLLEHVVVNLKLDKNPRFFEVTGKNSVWDALKSLAGRIGSQDRAVAPPAVAETPVLDTDADQERSRQARARR